MPKYSVTVWPNGFPDMQSFITIIEQPLEVIPKVVRDNYGDFATVGAVRNLNNTRPNTPLVSAELARRIVARNHT